ncbi:MAG: branched-chain amino acid ABC transporter permease [Deltaproteobacteria bacterium]|nr:branched-chain amino acid ABC transporter permease [Deltaproteobacteria bacterium]MBW2121771.1 branched-chain amino acid ABC transporter permease [Deltaproteobacteria bacterium]
MYASGYIAQQVLNGTVLGSMYALLALGMTVIYGILRLINFAHGAVITIGAFCFYVLFVSLHLPFLAAIALVVIFGGITGILLDLVAYRKIRGGPEVALLITSLGFYIFIENLVKMLASPQPYAFRPPPFLSQVNQTAGGVTFLTIDIFILLVSVGIMVFFALFVKKTKVGIAMRAIAESGETARLVGIDINRVIGLAFVLASAIAAITGFMWGGKYGQISYAMGFMAGVKAFVAVVIGGIGSIPGAMVGGYVLGIAETFSVALLPPGYAEYRDGIVFAILILVLLLKPSGIMGERAKV